MANYVWPLTNFTETQHYHNPGAYGGIDIAAPTGTPVMAIADGVVTRIGATGFGPYYVEIQHANGVVSYYGHNSAALVTVGQHVSQGQQIAKVGSLGISTGPHVHFGVRVNNADVDPDSFMKGAIKIESNGGTGGISSIFNPLDIPGEILKALTGVILGPVVDLLKTILGYLVNGLEVLGGVFLIFFGLFLLFESTESGRQFTGKVAKIAMIAK